MMQVDWWSWKCLRCGWEARSAFTVNPQHAVAEAVVRVHIKSHQPSDVPQITDPDEAAGIMRGIADAKAGRTSTLREIDLELKVQQLSAALAETRAALHQLQETRRDE